MHRCWLSDWQLKYIRGQGVQLPASERAASCGCVCTDAKKKRKKEAPKRHFDALSGSRQLMPISECFMHRSPICQPPPQMVKPVADLGQLETFMPGAPMVDGGSFNGAKAYKDSKVLNMITVLELHRRYHESTGLPKRRGRSMRDIQSAGSELFKEMAGPASPREQLYRREGRPPK